MSDRDFRWMAFGLLGGWSLRGFLSNQLAFSESGLALMSCVLLANVVVSFWRSR